MRRGEAYWVYCDGGSDFQGPCEVRLRVGDHLRYAPDRFHGTFVLRNRSPHPAVITLAQAGHSMPLDFVFRGILEKEVVSFTTPLPDVYRMPALEAGVEGSVTLRLPQSPQVVPGSNNLLRISSDAGTEYWVALYLDPKG
jgi:hypothetical protein